MKKILLALGVLAGFVSLFADAQSPPKSVPGNPQANPDGLSTRIRILGGGGGGPLNPFVCVPKNQDCDLTVIVTPDIDTTKCKLDVFNVVVGPNKSKNITWNLFPSDGTYQFDPDPAKAVEIDKNKDGTGNVVYERVDTGAASSLKHKKNIKSPEATVFGYTIRVQSRDGIRKCELDPVIVSRD